MTSPLRGISSGFFFALRAAATSAFDGCVEATTNSPSLVNARRMLRGGGGASGGADSSVGAAGGGGYAPTGTRCSRPVATSRTTRSPSASCGMNEYASQRPSGESWGVLMLRQASKSAWVSARGCVWAKDSAPPSRSRHTSPRGRRRGSMAPEAACGSARRQCGCGGTVPYSARIRTLRPWASSRSIAANAPTIGSAFFTLALS